MELSHVFLGLATGIPVMIVVGPIALLLIEIGMTRGVRGGVPAVIGVSAVDLMYASTAAVAGAAAASVLAPVESTMRVAGILVLGLLAWKLWRDAGAELAALDRRLIELAAQPQADHTASPVDGCANERGAVSIPGAGNPTGAAGARRSRLALGGQFFAATALSPITIVVFTSIVVSGGRGVGTAGWVLGMVVASLLVGFMFLAVGQGLGAVLGERATIRMRMGGALLIVAMAVWFAFG